MSLLPINKMAMPMPEVLSDPGPRGKFVWVEIDALVIDTRYQRPIGSKGEKNIRQVVANFSWSLFSPIVVARRGDKFAVIDGQHRAVAAKTRGDVEKLPAIVIEGGEADEARAFAAINGLVTGILPQQLWHARLAANDPEAVAAQRIYDKVGVRIIKSAMASHAMKKGQTLACDALEACFRKYGPGVLELALRTVVDTKDGNPGYIKSPLIRPTCAVLAANGAWAANPAGVLRAIRTVGIKYLWESAVASNSNSTRKRAVADTYAEKLTELFKKELK